MRAGATLLTTVRNPRTLRGLGWAHSSPADADAWWAQWGKTYGRVFCDNPSAHVGKHGKDRDFVDWCGYFKSSGKITSVAPISQPTAPSPAPTPTPTPPSPAPAAPAACGTNWTTATDAIRALVDQVNGCQSVTVPDLISACPSDSDGGTGSYSDYIEARSALVSAQQAALTACAAAPAADVAGPGPNFSYDATSGLYYDPSTGAWYRCAGSACSQVAPPASAVPVQQAYSSGGGGSYAPIDYGQQALPSAPTILPDTSPLLSRGTKVGIGVGGAVLLGGIVLLMMRGRKRGSRRA